MESKYPKPILLVFNFIFMKNNIAETISELNAEAKKFQEDTKNQNFRDISIWLDSYDDIFSDFDLYELKKVCKENKSPINNLNLLIPDKSRSDVNENLIIKRLHTHLKKNYHDFRELLMIQKRNGFLSVFAGVVLMIGASYISLLKSENFLMHTILVILEPAGWFILWTGLDDLRKSLRIQRSELDLFIKMAKSKIVFVSN